VENNNEKSYQLVISLRQETPMIHFQYDEAGAILRGSELKPKLDKFILKKHNDNVPDEWKQRESSKGCKQEGSSDDKPRVALRYKVKIEVPDENPIKSKWDEAELRNAKAELKTVNAELREMRKKKNLDKKGEAELKDKKQALMNFINKYDINSMYFGNMGDGDKKETVYYENPLTLTITCFVPALLDEIKGCIEEFFLTTNFGTRQSKGFGGFSVKEINGEKRELNPVEKLKKDKYIFFYCEFSSKEPNAKLKIAEGIYAVMKGGINRSRNPKNKDSKPDEGKYIKGYIQRKYLDEVYPNKNSKVGSDKAFMKSHIIRGEKRETEDYDSYTEYEYVRALLGVTDKITFKDDIRRGDVTITSDKIKRFKSSVQIKVVGKYIIFIITDTYKDILGEEFLFKYGPESGKIKVPESFEPNDFINGFVKYFEKEKQKLKNLNYTDAAQVTLIPVNVEGGKNA
jgi:hypothetical protein